jgi:uncharacterized membrane protein
MNTSALLMFLAANISVTAFTVYYFRKVLNTPAQKGEKKEACFSNESLNWRIFQQGIVKVKIIICGIWVFSPTFRR